MDTLYLRIEPENSTFSEEFISLDFPHLSLKWNQPSKSLHRCLKALIAGESESRLINLYEEDPIQFYYFLESLKKDKILKYTLFDKEPLLSVEAHPVSWKKAILPIQLSRFAYFRTLNGRLYCESSLTSVRLEIHQPALLSLFGALAQPISIFPTNYPASFLEVFFDLLYSVSMTAAADQSPSLASWEFHDLLFHSKSRKGRSLAPIGSTFRFLGKTPPSPALLPPSPQSIPLFRPKPEPSESLFTQILEKRTSIRTQGSKPISFEQLGEFLYRSARVKQRIQLNHHEATKRPYPGGGACYELEIFPLIHRCVGLASGLYRYDPEAHALSPIETNQENLELLLKDSVQATGTTEFPQVLLCLAARFHRVAWKYESMAYSTILKNAGALIQTLYLVATAMDLAPCAIGYGDSDLFAETSKTDYYELTTVAEFMLGTLQSVG